MKRFIPDTATINSDRDYFLSGDTFIKVDSNINRGLNEASSIKRLNHKYIQKYVDSYVKENKHFLVTEFFKGDSLETTRLTQEEKYIVCVQIFEVFSYLLENDTVHGDINVSNILFDGEKILLIDFEMCNKKTGYEDLHGPPWGVLDTISRI